MLYLDSSALVKRYIEEEGSELIVDAMDGASAIFMSRIGYVESVRAISASGSVADLARFERDWREVLIAIEVDVHVGDDAARFAVAYELRSLDAIHLASAAMLPQADVRVATWDKRLHEAARRMDLKTLPETLPYAVVGG